VTLSPEDIKSILEQNTAEDQGKCPYNLPCVEQAIRVRCADIAKTIIDFCFSQKSDPAHRRWLIEILHTTAMSQELTAKQALRFLFLIEREERNGHLKGAALIQAIECLGGQTYAPALVQFLDILVRKKRVSGWRWTAYTIIGVLLSRQTQFHLRKELTEELVLEARNETDSSKRDRLIFLSGRLAEHQKTSLE